nr:hypothetical protein [Tanacetum cinerariifolium]
KNVWDCQGVQGGGSYNGLRMCDLGVFSCNRGGEGLCRVLARNPGKDVQCRLFKTYTGPCLACSRVFAGDIYGDHVISCAGIIGIKHHHNVVRDTLVDICYLFRILTGKEVDIGLDRGFDKPLRPTDMFLYSWDEGLDVCVDLIGSSPLTQTRMVDLYPVGP